MNAIAGTGRRQFGKMVVRQNRFEVLFARYVSTSRRVVKNLRIAEAAHVNEDDLDAGLGEADTLACPSGGHTPLWKEAGDRKKVTPWLRPDGRTEIDRVVQRVSQEVAGYSGPGETKPNTEDMNKSIEEMIRKKRVNVFVNVAVQQCVVLEYVEDAIYKLSNVHAQVDSYVSDVVRLHVPMMTLDETVEKMDEFSDAVLVQGQ